MATFWFYIISCILSKGLFGLLSPLCLHFIYINIIIYYPCLQFVSSVLTVNCGACSSHAVTAIWGQAPVAAGMVALTSLYPTTFPSSSLGPWWSPGFLKPHQIWQTNRTISSAKSRDAILRSPNRSWNRHSWDTFCVWLLRSCSLLQRHLAFLHRGCGGCVQGFPVLSHLTDFQNLQWWHDSLPLLDHRNWMNGFWWVVVVEEVFS